MNGHGFKPDIPKPEDYVFGGNKLSGKVLNQYGQWDIYLPDSELQKRNGLETQNCVSYGTLNCLEIILRKRGILANKSERYTGVLADTDQSGNSPNKVAESIRKKGVIPEEMLPFNESIVTWDDYYSPNPMTEKYLKIGQKWINEWIFGHEWVFANDYSGKRQDILKEALKRSPLGVSVFAWIWNDDGIYINPQKMPDNHYCTLYGYKDGEYWKVFDHYSNDRKKLDWNYPFGFCKRYFLAKRKKVNLIRKIIIFLCRLIP